MAGKSNIEWTEHTWNPIVGCSVLSPGCTNCYAMKMAGRIEAMQSSPNYKADGPRHYRNTTKSVNGNIVWTGKLALAHDSILLEPLRRKKPTTYFVNSMGDLFHEDTPVEWIDLVVAIMGLCPQHTFQVLTKRADRMRNYFSHAASNGRQDVRNHLAWVAVPKVMERWEPGWVGEDIDGPHRSRAIAAFKQWPLPNVWVGVSAERQKEADERIPQLLQTPGAVRFISAEPLLGAIDLTRLGDVTMSLNAFTGEARHLLGMKDKTLGRLDWVIVGGESGPNARPMHPDWARSLRDQCAAAGVPFFFKQWGEWAPPNIACDRHGEIVSMLPDGRVREWANDYPDSRLVQIEMKTMRRVGEKSAGRTLDSNLHSDMPRGRG